MDLLARSTRVQEEDGTIEAKRARVEERKKARMMRAREVMEESVRNIKVGDEEFYTLDELNVEVDDPVFEDGWGEWDDAQLDKVRGLFAL